MTKSGGNTKQTVSGFGSIALGALASRDCLLQTAFDVQSDSGTLIQLTAACTILGADQYDGPFMWGLATGALTASDIEESIENQGPASPAHSSTFSAREARWRHIRILGFIFPNDSAGVYNVGEAVMDKVVKLGWAEADTGWRYWIYNLGAALVAGGTWEVTEKAFVIYD